MSSSGADSGPLRMLQDDLQSFKRGLGMVLEDTAMAWTAGLVDALRANCPYPTIGKTIEWSIGLKEGYRLTLNIGSTHPRGQKILWGIEQGRPGMEVIAPKGMPLHVMQDFSKNPSQKARMKFETEKDSLGRGTIIRKRVILTPIAPKPFIIRTLMQSLNDLVPMLRDGIERLARGYR